MDVSAAALRVVLHLKLVRDAPAVEPLGAHAGHRLDGQQQFIAQLVMDRAAAVARVQMGGDSLLFQRTRLAVEKSRKNVPHTITIIE